MTKTKWLCAILGLSIVFAIGNVTACGSNGDSGDGSSNGNSGNTSNGGFGTNEGGTGEQFAKILITPQDPVVNVDLNAKTPVTEFSAKAYAVTEPRFHSPAVPGTSRASMRPASIATGSFRPASSVAKAQSSSLSTTKPGPRARPSS